MILEDKQFRNRLVIYSLLKSFGPRLPRQWQTQMDSRIGDEVNPTRMVSYEVKVRGQY